jgi:hypothetical protein
VIQQERENMEGKVDKVSESMGLKMKEELEGLEVLNKKVAELYERKEIKERQE